MTKVPNMDLLLLTQLSVGPMHGYGLIVALRDGSDGILDYPEGTIYPALHRLEVDGLVLSTSTRADGRVRRMYRLTPKGKRATAARVASWRSYVEAVEKVLAVPAVTA